MNEDLLPFLLFLGVDFTHSACVTWDCRGSLEDKNKATYLAPYAVFANLEVQDFWIYLKRPFERAPSFMQ